MSRQYLIRQTFTDEAPLYLCNNFYAETSLSKYIFETLIKSKRLVNF